MLLTKIPTDVFANILAFLPIFDIHNFWQVSKKTSHLKPRYKEQITQHYNYLTYNKLQTFYRSLVPFAYIDVLDTTGIWSEAVVIGQQVYRGIINIKVKYLGYSDGWIEWLRADYDRIAPYGTRCYNGTNELFYNNRVIYYHYGQWKTYYFVALCSTNSANPTNPVKIKLKKNGVVLTLRYIKEHLAPVSRKELMYA